jgi:hypothetical protein
MKTVTVQSILLNAASRAGLDGSSIDTTFKPRNRANSNQ